MNKNHVFVWLTIGCCSLIFLGLSVVNAAAGESSSTTPTPLPAISPLAQEIASKTGIDLSLVNEMLAGGIPAEAIDQEAALEWPAHLNALAQRKQVQLQHQSVSGLDLSALEADSRYIEPDPPTVEEQLWQQIEAAHIRGDTQAQLTLAKQLPNSQDKQRLITTLTDPQTSGSVPQAINFIGINGSPCTYSSWADALAAAQAGDTLYVEKGKWIGRIGTITKDLTIIAAQNDCQEAASAGVTIDGDDTSSSFGGVAEIGPEVDVTFVNLTLTNGDATEGGILYVNHSNLILDSTDLTFGNASKSGGGLQLVENSTAVMKNNSEIVNCSAVDEGAVGGGVAMFDSHLSLYDTSRIGDYLEGNLSTLSGGGVYIDGGTLTLHDTSRIRSNQAYELGGGIFALGDATVTLQDSASIGYVFASANNMAADGAGIFLEGNGTSLVMEDNSTIQNNTAGGYGGGVFIRAGSRLSMNSASIIDNDAVNRGGGIYTQDAARVDIDNGSLIANNRTTDSLGTGGGLYIFGDSVTITITHSSVMTNTADYYGGVRIFGDQSTSQLILESGSSISYNEATVGDGGGIGVFKGVVNLNDSVVEHNIAPSNGGGIDLFDGTLNMVDSHIRYNEAGNHGGGIYNTFGTINIACQNNPGSLSSNKAKNGNGGGVYDTSGNTLSIKGDPSAICYFSNNSAGQNGGGLYLINDTDLESTGAVIYVNNAAHDDGGAIYLSSAASAIFADTSESNSFSTLYNNHALNGSGGAIYANEGSQVTMYGARVGAMAGNISHSGSGGGIFVDNSELNLFNTRVFNNRALYGGGIAAYGASIKIDSLFKDTVVTDLTGDNKRNINPCVLSDLPANWYCSEVSGNQVESEGGGLYLYDCDTEIDHTAILTNTADVGAAIRIIYRSANLKNSLIAGNEADNASNPTIIDVNAADSTTVEADLVAIHNTIAANRGIGIVYADNTSGEFHNNIVWGNDSRGNLSSYTNATCNDTQSEAWSGTDINRDPEFITTPRGAYRLSFTSPAVNQCNDHGLAYDLDGVLRPWGAGYDMGAFEVIAVFLPMTIR